MEDIINTIALSLPAFLLAIVFHEAAHAWMAKRFGDMTGEQMGRLSLNPAVHYDLIGSIIFPLFAAAISGVMYGWAKPVPVDPRRFKNMRMGLFWVSFAGPLANLILMVIATILLALLQAKVSKTFSYYGVFQSMLGRAITINIIIAVFNLIPFPPLDGSKMVSSMLSYENARKFEDLEQWGIAFFFFLMFTPVLSWLMMPAGLLSDLLLSFFKHLFAGS